MNTSDTNLIRLTFAAIAVSAIGIVAYLAGGAVLAQNASGSLVGSKHSIAKTLGFDTCSHPSEEQMKVWGEQSPYSYIGVYIGGENAGCKNFPERGWFKAVHTPNRYGVSWSFLPTWVGAQPACTTLGGSIGKFSENLETVQGEAGIEVNRAVARAEKDGFAPGSIIYYDLEGYEGGAGCYASAKMFMEVWAKRLGNIYEFESGMYGSACASHVAEMWGNTDRLSDVWMAQWEIPKSVYAITPSCVPKADWEVHRLHQYETNLTSVYGGVYIKGYDPDCAYGMVAGTDPEDEPACYS
jgi:hypothetical protein